MDDKKKTKAELVRELKSLRRRVAELERTSDVRASGGRAAGAVRKATVLVVDDQAEVRSLLRRRLEAAGYEVVEATSAEEALRAYRGAPADVVLTDLVMPGRSGGDLIEDLLREFPQAKLVAMSGATGMDVQTLLKSAASSGAISTLPKPFTSKQLIEAVRGALG